MQHALPLLILVAGPHPQLQGAKQITLVLLQINPLRNRLRLIGIIQSCAAISFVLALGAMIATYFDERLVSSLLFLGSILLMMGSMLLFTREIQIANTALDVHLSDLETHQEWEQYLKPMRRRRNAKKS